MIKIKNEKQINELCEKYQITLRFANWNYLAKELVHYQKGEIIAICGENYDRLFFLVKGSIRFTCVADNYEEYFFFDAYNNGLFGEVEYLLNIPSITQSEAIEDCDCIVIPINKNRKFLDNDLIFQNFLGQVLARKYNELRDSYMNAKVFFLRTRLAAYLINNANCDTNISNLTQISKILRCSYRQLLREFKFFCEVGCLEHLNKKGKYKIANYEKLEAYTREEV